MNVIKKYVRVSNSLFVSSIIVFATLTNYQEVSSMTFDIRPVYIPYSGKIDYYELVIPLTNSTKKKYFKKLGVLLEGNN